MFTAKLLKTHTKISVYCNNTSSMFSIRNALFFEKQSKYDFDFKSNVCPLLMNTFIALIFNNIEVIILINKS